MRFRVTPRPFFVALTMIITLATGLQSVSAASLTRQTILSSAAPRPVPGQVVATLPHTTHAYPPGNFPFQTAKSSDGLLIVNYYGRPASYGQSILATIEGYLKNPIEVTLGYGPTRPVNIYIYNSRADFLIGTQTPDTDEVGAFSDFSTNSVYLPLETPDDLGAYMPHELTHIVFHEHGDVGHIQSKELRFYPLWLDEGLAEHDVPADNIAAIDDAETLYQAVSTHTLVNFYSVFNNDYPTDVNEDYLCYAEARAYITYLITTFGLTKFHQFVDGVKDGAINMTAEIAFGADLQTLQSQWEQSLRLSAVPHDKGFALATPVAAVYYQGATDPAVTRTKPFAIPGEANALAAIWPVAGGALTLALILIGVEFFLARRRKPTPVAVPASVTATAAGGGDASQEDTLPTPAVSARQTAAPAMARPFPWATAIVVGLLAPIVVGVTLLWSSIDTSLLWRSPFIAGAVAAGVLVVALATLLVLATVGKRLSVVHIGGVLAALALIPILFVMGNNAGQTQGLAYEKAGNDALALNLLTDAHASSAVLARVNGEWAESAFETNDYPDAMQHVQAALQAQPTLQSAHALETRIMGAWGANLLAARRFAQAAQMYDAQHAFAGCDQACQGVAQEGSGEARLGEASDALFHGQASAALPFIQQAAKNFPKTTAAQSAQAIVAGQSNPLAAAYAASGRGDLTAMNLLLLFARAQNPTSVLAASASEVAEPVTGSIHDLSQSPTGNLRVFFLAFATQNAAIGWYTGSTDTSLFKIATTTNTDGTFNVRLTPGYWYLTIWDDPSQANNYYFNVSDTPSYGVFTLPPYEPTDGIELVGY
jgi:hypothetical protein